MTKPIVGLNHTETALFSTLRDYRNAWYEASEKLTEENRIIMLPIVDIYEKQYQQARAFVCKALNRDIRFVEGVLNGDYKIIRVEE